MSKNLLARCLICTVAAFVFAICALVSTNKQGTVILNLSWGYGTAVIDGVDLRVYIGLPGIFLTEYFDNEYTSARFLFQDGCDSDFCSTCKHYNAISIGFLAVFFITTIVSLFAAFTRFFGTDSATIKNIGMGSSACGVVLGLVSLITFGRNCFYDGKDFINEQFGTEFRYYYGAGFVLLATAVAVLFTDIVFSGMVPVADSKSDTAYRGVTSNSKNNHNETELTNQA